LLSEKNTELVEIYDVFNIKLVHCEYAHVIEEMFLSGEKYTIGEKDTLFEGKMEWQPIKAAFDIAASGNTDVGTDGIKVIFLVPNVFVLQGGSFRTEYSPGYRTKDSTKHNTVYSVSLNRPSNIS